MMHFLSRMHYVIKITAVTGLALYSLTACKGIGHSIGGASDNLGRTAAKAGSKTTSPKLPPPHVNSGNQKTYKVVDVRKSADELIASLDTANGLYEIYVDCRAGVITRGQVSPAEQANVVRDACSFAAGSSSSNSSTTSSTLGGNGQSVDSETGAKEQAWQDYYRGCSGLNNVEWRAQKSKELGREFTDEDVYNDFEAQWRGVFEESWKRTGERPRGCG